MKARAKYVEEGRIDRAAEPFSVRAKQFWPLSDTGYVCEGFVGLLGDQIGCTEGFLN